MSRIYWPASLLRRLHGCTPAVLLQRLGDHRGQQAERHLHSLTWALCATRVREFAQSEQGVAYLFTRTLNRHGRGNRHL